MSNELAKKLRIMTDLIMPYNKWYRDNKDYVLKNIDEFNIPKLVEKTIAKLGNHEVIDGYGFDLSDGSEIKTCSVYSAKKKQNGGEYLSYYGIVTNVATSTGTLKTGALRVVLYNRFTDELRYFFLPNTFWSKLHLNKVGHGSSLKFNYSINDDTFSIVDNYEVDSIKELATAINC
jgi:hypothetical protein